MITGSEFTYYAYLARLLEARLKGEDELEHLDRLDAVWETLSQSAITRINAVSARFAANPYSEQQYLHWFTGNLLGHIANTTAVGSSSSEPAEAPQDRSAAELCVA